MDSVRERIGQVLTDYRDGLLDSLEDGIDAIQEIVGTEREGVDVSTLRDARPKIMNLGHSIGTNPPK